ncbi:succinylglutamate desuccinylase/aspartoacylase family protein [Nakamurella lactea]|uniref:succinylglutamate desuccinylase/aspartoacylase family protein n=1 Tax=Nakamurella lactea TaxID=459515 RepID=UPI0004267B93|nr:succinylglutamate desuccinylase/aspartoacylase family protein [Nakamurella lactea]
MFHLPSIETLTGSGAGPTVALLGGVHGDELEGVLAVRSAVSGLRVDSLAGTVRWAAPAHPAAWAANCRSSPLDQENLARVFPGDASGSPTRQIAAHLTENLIADSDLLIDLHSAGLGFDMPLLVGFHSTGSLAERASAVATAFAAPITWQHPESSDGRSLSAAAGLGIPSIYVEGRGGGRLRQRDLDCYTGGVLRVLQHLGMIVDAPVAAGPSVIVRGEGNTDEGIVAVVAGYFVCDVEVGEPVVAGQSLGRILGEHADLVAEVAAPIAGRVMLLRAPARVIAGDTLAIVAAEVGSHSDAEVTT